MRIASVEGTLPGHRYQQQTLTRRLEEIWRDDPRVCGRLADLHRNTRVAYRHLAVPLEDYAGLDTFGKCNDTWIRVATTLGRGAVTGALERAGLGPRDVDVLVFSTVTGISSPSVDARLVNAMGLRDDLKRLPLFGLGCVAGAAGVARAADYLRGHPEQVAVVLTVELCSLTLQRDDRSLANQVASGLFGDGACAAVLTGAGHRAPASGPRILASRSVFYPDTEDVMGWDVSGSGFRIVLSAAVPAVARERLGGDVDAFLGDQGLRREDVARWICHPGGPKVLRAVQDGLGLPPDALLHSWQHLAECGNLSSASVLFVLAAHLEDPPPVGSHGLLMAMGPGFCSELVLLQW